MTENRRRALAESCFEAGLTERAEELFQSWLADDPGWGWGWIGWADCYLRWAGKPGDYGRAEELLRRGYSAPDARDRDCHRQNACRDLCRETGRPGEDRESGSMRGGCGQGAGSEPCPGVSSWRKTRTPVRCARPSWTSPARGDKPRNCMNGPWSQYHGPFGR